LQAQHQPQQHQQLGSAATQAIGMQGAYSAGVLVSSGRPDLAGACGGGTPVRWI
jgi:hypothetical protein